MAYETSAAQARTKRAWERIFTQVATDRPVPTGVKPSTDANREELRASVLVAAMALDELYETGELRPDPQFRILESMRNLLLVLDSLTPLPDGWVPAADLNEVLGAIRAARNDSSL